MSQHEIPCVVIRRKPNVQQSLDAALCAGNLNAKCWYVNDPSELPGLLKKHQPMLVFCALGADKKNTPRLLSLLQQLVPDCILVNVNAETAQGPTRVGRYGTEVCSMTTSPPMLLQQQLNYLFAYVRLKTDFRHCKHLLSVAELRSHWLVNYAREAVAYISHGRHLQVNIAYLTLFGFNAEPEALKTTVLKLVRPEDHAIFLRMSLEAERGVRPSNKLLLTLRHRHGKPFRAEVRFIPSVYRGRRCVQLYIHPLLRGVNAIGHQQKSPNKRSNPWQEKSRGMSRQDQLPRVLTDELIQQLQPLFRESLNLQGNTQPALFTARPWLQYAPTVKLNYDQVLGNAEDDLTRFHIDQRNVIAALRYLVRQKASPLPQKVMVGLGSWLRSDVKMVAQLLQLLQQSPSLNRQLVLAIKAADFVRGSEAVTRLLTLLQATGVELLLDEVSGTDDDLFALLEKVGGKMVRVHPIYARQLLVDGVIPEALQLLLQQMHERSVAVVVDGVQDINSLNLLCHTTACYLQGPVLETFSR